MDLMSLDALPWNQINVIKRNISAVKLQEFVFLSRGTVMDLMIAMTIQMSKSVDRFRALTISSNARTPNASLKRTFVMERMTAVITLMNHMNLLALLHHSDVRLVNGRVQASQLDVSI